MKTKYYLFQQVKEQNNDITFNCIKTCNLAGLGQMFHIEKKTQIAVLSKNISSRLNGNVPHPPNTHYTMFTNIQVRDIYM